jgi:hypothetical protein
MASKTTVQLIDDMDGGEADETITFGFRGATYEIDLAEDHIAEIADFLAPFIEVARRISAPSLRGRHAVRVGSGNSGRNDKAWLANVRQWAKDNGFQVSDRGRIAQSIIDAYEAAH